MNLSPRFVLGHPFKTIVTFATFIYLVLLFYIFFLARRRRGPTLPWDKRHVNLIPLKDKLDYFVSQPDVSYMQLRDFYVDIFGNILLFIPFAFFLFFYFRIKDLRRIILITVITSISIELIQLLLSIGVADIDDVILNATGGIIGTFILKVLTNMNIFKKNVRRV